MSIFRWLSLTLLLVLGTCPLSGKSETADIDDIFAKPSAPVQKAAEAASKERAKKKAKLKAADNNDADDFSDSRGLKKKDRKTVDGRCPRIMLFFSCLAKTMRILHTLGPP
jgi:hypothetical protein